MSTLKSLRDRIRTIQSTQKITQAMKLVAAAKLKRAQEKFELSRSYPQKLNELLTYILATTSSFESEEPLLLGRKEDKTKLLIVVTSDQGLCGSFNTSIHRQVEHFIKQQSDHNCYVKLLIIGQKGLEVLSKLYPKLLMNITSDINPSMPLFNDVSEVTQQLLKLFQQQEFDSCDVMFNSFKSAISQEVTLRQLIPFSRNVGELAAKIEYVYDYEPLEEAVLKKLSEEHITATLFNILLESQTSEYGARMTAMDSASRNANEIIKKLQLQYNRTRQTQVTQELMEIISGADAL